MLSTARGLTAGRLSQTRAAPSHDPVWPILLAILTLFIAAAPAYAVHIVLVGDSTVSETDGWGPGFATFLDLDVKL